MNCAAPDYRKLTLSNIRSQEFKHVLLLLYWPVYGLMFLYFERLRTGCTYHTVESVLDEFIPFIPQFIIPYFGWFVYLIGGQILFFFRDVNTFKKSMWFVIITYSVTSLIYFVYPTQQELRPVIEGQGIFEKIVSGLYVFDTNTNVCPSIHVLGSMAICFSALNSDLFKGKYAKILNVVTALLISFSTVFLKQHSIIDVIWAFVLSFAVYPVCFGNNRIANKLIS